MKSSQDPNISSVSKHPVDDFLQNEYQAKFKMNGIKI